MLGRRKPFDAIAAQVFGNTGVVLADGHKIAGGQDDAQRHRAIGQVLVLAEEVGHTQNDERHVILTVRPCPFVLVQRGDDKILRGVDDRQDVLDFGPLGINQMHPGSRRQHVHSLETQIGLLVDVDHGFPPMSGMAA